MKHYLGTCLVLLTLAAIGWFALRSCVSAADHTIASVRDAFASVLHVQPQITVNQRVIYAQTAPIAEFAVVTKEEAVKLDFSLHYEVLTVQVPLTEKKLTAEADYRIKAGFDLTEPFTAAIDPITHEVHAKLPRARILSVEIISAISYHGDDALLNRITDAERQDIVNSLNQAARNAAENSGLKADAEQQVSQRLNELMRHDGQPIQLEWAPAPQVIPSK